MEDSGEVIEVVWESPCFDANVIVGGELVGVNDKPFSVATLEEAVEETRLTGRLTLAARARGESVTWVITYSGGNRFAHLMRGPASDPVLHRVFEGL